MASQGAFVADLDDTLKCCYVILLGFSFRNHAARDIRGG
jgi:hypothetical protein